MSRTAPAPSIPDVLLDPNHTNFILVDDGSEGQFGKEIQFRSKLEVELQRGKSLQYYQRKRLGRAAFLAQRQMSQLSADKNSEHSEMSLESHVSENEEEDEEGSRETVPMILIVVQGGPNSLFTVVESLKQNVPVLVIAVSSDTVTYLK